MLKSEPLIVVKDVEKSSAFYQKALKCKSGHGGDEYEMLMYEDQLLLQLHHQDAHEHPGLWNPRAKIGNGVALWFRTDRFKETVKRIKKLKAEIIHDVHVNPLAQHHEIWFRDLDGYLVVVSDSFGDAETAS